MLEVQRTEWDGMARVRAWSLRAPKNRKEFVEFTMVYSKSCIGNRYIQVLNVYLPLFVEPPFTGGGTNNQKIPTRLVGSDDQFEILQKWLF